MKSRILLLIANKKQAKLEIASPFLPKNLTG